MGYLQPKRPYRPHERPHEPPIDIDEDWILQHDNWVIPRTDPDEIRWVERLAGLIGAYYTDPLQRARAAREMLARIDKVRPAIRHIEAQAVAELWFRGWSYGEIEEKLGVNRGMTSRYVQYMRSRYGDWRTIYEGDDDEVGYR